MARVVDVDLWMGRIGNLPRGLDAWAYREVFASDRYLMLSSSKDGARRTATCTHCGAVSPMRLKVGVEARCPACRVKATTVSAYRERNLFKSEFVAVVQRIRGAVVVRNVRCFADFRKLPVKLGHGEWFRWVHPDDDRSVLKFAPEWTKAGPDGRAWHYSPHSSNNETQRVHPCCRAALKDTRWKYSGLPEAGARGVELPVSLYLRAYLRYPCIEMLAKYGMNALLKQAVYSGAPTQPVSERLRSTDLEKVVGIPKRYWNIVKELDLRTEAIAKIQEVIKLGYCPTIEDARMLTDGVSAYFGDDKWGYLLFHRYPWLDYRITMDYLAKQRRDERQNYRDYLGMAQQLGLDTRDGDIIRPKDLKAAHDRLSKLITEHKKAVNDAALKRMREMKREQLEIKRDGLLTRIPDSASDLAREGTALHHCVASYADRVAKGECLIVFVRQEEAPEVPYVTVEVRGDRVAQVRGKNNAAPPPEVERFITAWQRGWSGKAETAGRRAT